MAPRTFLLEWSPRCEDEVYPWLLQIFDEGEFVQERRFLNIDRESAQTFADDWVITGNPLYL